MSGSFTEYPLSGLHVLEQITSGSDGALWFADQNAIGKITTSGTVTEYKLKHKRAFVFGVTLGADGNIWFADVNTGIGKITPQGVVNEYGLPGPIRPHFLFGITKGPDGKVWFTDSYSNKVGNISPNSHVELFTVPTPNSGPLGITLGAYGNLYFSEYNAAKLGEITRSGKISEYALPPGDHNPQFVALGYSDTSIWITDFDSSNNNQLRQFIIQSKTFTPPIVPPIAGVGGFLQSGPDGNMWIPGTYGQIVIALTHVLTTNPSSVQIPGIGQAQTVQIHETQNERGSYTATSSDQSIATVGPVSQSNSFVVTAQGIGSCSIRVSDSIGNYIDVPVTVQ